MASAGSLFGQNAQIQSQAVANHGQTVAGFGTAIGQIAASRGMTGFFGSSSGVPPDPYL
ncbi:hypothetical protein HK414_22555 [Ramlibacter terrae]|uniref:Uncharacterized protein n=1 Tax=Ramlibacter terrae TaxID=2732511 RepID=A0ABX6P759_9BURK|nr:hypothetical protein HK414_22555 [Ramlibacter terrae]